MSPSTHASTGRAIVLSAAVVMTAYCDAVAGDTPLCAELELLGSLPGGDESDARSIGQSGIVAGSGQTPDGFRAYRFVDGIGMQPLGVLPEANSSVGYGVNNVGQVVGISSRGSSFIRAFRFTDGVGIENLGTLPGGDDSRAYAINTAGQVTGYSENEDGDGRAFRYTDGVGMEDLGVLPGASSSDGTDINELGVVVGDSSGGITTTAFRYTDGVGMQNLGYLSGHNRSCALGVNNLSQVVGYSRSQSDTTPFRYTDGIGMTALEELAPERVTEAFAINDLGWIVGWSQDAEPVTHAVLWTPDGDIVNLNDLIDNDFYNVRLYKAFDVNNSREIVGIALSLINGDNIAFRLRVFIPSAADLDGDCVVNSADLAILLGAWGPCGGCAEDLDGSGAVDAADLAILLGNWGRS